MKNKFFSIVFILILFCARGYGQDAEQILKQIQKTYEAMKNVCAEFKQTFYWELANETQEFSGKVCTRNGVQFRIETGDQLIITDGKTIWTVSHANKQVLIDDASESTEDNPFLKTFLRNYIENYRARFIEETKIDEIPHYVIELNAKSEDEFVRSIKLWVDKRTYWMIKIVQLDINNNHSTYEVRNIDTNAKLSDALFQLTPPSGYEVVDMRTE